MTKIQKETRVTPGFQNTFRCLEEDLFWVWRVTNASEENLIRIGAIVGTAFSCVKYLSRYFDQGGNSYAIFRAKLPEGDPLRTFPSEYRHVVICIKHCSPS